MSMFRPLTVTCPSCQAAVDVKASLSVNADRRPDLRDAILDGSFQRETCPACQAQFRLDPQLNYLDIGRGVWVSAQPLSRLRDWIEDEDEAIAAFDKAYGSGAAPSAQAIGQALTARLVFGWAALIEKLTVRDHQLDDVALELSKLAIIDGVPGQPMKPGNELRLEGVVGDELDMVWMDAQSQAVIERMRVPRELYDGVVADQAGWAELHAKLDTGPWVDLQKLYMGRGRTPAAA